MHKFRAKKENGNTWYHFDVYEYINNPDADSIPIFLQLHLDSETLGIYSGFKDRNGKEIYEGDIIRHPELTETIYLVKKSDKSPTLYLQYQNGATTSFLYEYSYPFVVIGNIHDGNDYGVNKTNNYV